MGELTRPDLMVPETCDGRVFSITNEGNFVADVDLIDVYLDDYSEEHKICFAAFLNSTIFALFREIEGRISGGGASRLKIYELKSIKVLPPGKIPREMAEKIQDLFEILISLKINSAQFVRVQEKMDRLFLTMIDPSISYERVRKGLLELQKARKRH